MSLRGSPLARTHSLRTTAPVTKEEYFYEYAGDDPINNVDPTGLCLTGTCWIKHTVHTIGCVVKNHPAS
jgi:hypothetical protein